MKRYVSCLAGLMIVFLAAASLRAETYAEIVRWAPAEANAVIVVDLERALSTSLAGQQFWQQVLQLKSPDGRTFVKPAIRKMVMATQFDPAAEGTPEEILLIESAAMPKDETIAERQGATLESIGGYVAMRSPRGMYLVRLSPNLLGVVTPPNRQRVTRWVNQGAARTQHELSQSLSDAAARCQEKNAVIFMAMDLKDALSAQNVAGKLRQSSAVEGKDIDIDAAAQAIAGVESLALRVLVEGDTVSGVLEATFADDVAVLAPIAGPLVVEAIAAQGLELGDLQSWDAKVEGHRIIMSGPLSESGLGRLLSLVTPPRPDLEVAAEEDAPADTKPKTPAEASLAYYRTVMAYVADLRGISNPLASASYLTKYARKIEQTPILGVDPQLLAWSEAVVLGLTKAADEIRNAELEGRRKAAANVGVVDAARGAPALQDTGNYGNDNYNNDYGDDDDDSMSDRKQARRRMDYDLHWQREQRATERTKAKLDAKAAGKQAALDVLSDLQAKTVEVRRAMTQKYGVEF